VVSTAFIRDFLIGEADIASFSCYSKPSASAGGAFTQSIAGSPNASISYTPGEEGKLLTILGIIGKALAEEASAKEQAAVDALQNRKEILFAKAAELLRVGEGPRAKAVLRNAGEEFGKDPGVLATIGTMLVEADFEFDAMEFFLEAIETFPRDPAPYGPLAACYMKFREYDRDEKLYLRAIKEFDSHPRTMINLGKLYIAWNKRNKAFEVLNQVLRKHPDDEEAKELFAKVDR
jgi:Flp pilus assembly protein TadD